MNAVRTILAIDPGTTHSRYISNPKILALDLGTKTGWAIGDRSGLVVSGMWDLKIRKDESAGMRLIRFCGKLRDTVKGMQINLIAFESVSVGGGARSSFSAAVFQAEMQGMVKRFSTEEHVESCGVNLTEIKKHTTGKGNAKKADMMAAVSKRISKEIEDDNEADAIALFYFVIETHFAE